MDTNDSNLISAGSKFVGELNMWNAKFEYIFVVEEVGNETFKYTHEIYSSGGVKMLVDKKSGNGQFRKIDENVYEFKYSDPETAFDSTINVNTKEIQGTASQIKGFSQGMKGTFQLALQA